MTRREPIIVEIEPLFVLELARDLRGREVLVPRLPDADEQLPPVAVPTTPDRGGRRGDR